MTGNVLVVHRMQLQPHVELTNRRHSISLSADRLGYRSRLGGCIVQRLLLRANCICPRSRRVEFSRQHLNPAVAFGDCFSKLDEIVVALQQGVDRNAVRASGNCLTGKLAVGT
jgi:hypothetical protein